MRRIDERAAHHRKVAKLSTNRHHWTRSRAWELVKERHPRLAREIWAEAYDRFPTISGKRRSI